jgi:hypothetical protein
VEVEVMNNILIGVALVFVNTILGLRNQVDWWTVIGIACGALLIGMGIAEDR